MNDPSKPATTPAAAQPLQTPPSPQGGAPPATKPPTGPRTPPRGAPAVPRQQEGRRIGEAPPARSGGWDIKRGMQKTPERVLVYGAPGIGKSTLAAYMPNPVFLDLQGETSKLDVARIDIGSWDELRAAVRDKTLFDQFETIVVDNVSKAQALAASWVCANVPDKGGEKRDSLEKFAFGGGPQLLADTFRNLISDLEIPYRDGKHIVLIAHDITERVPNPNGENFIRYEPDLYQSGTGKSTTSIRNQVVQWVDHVLAIYYDIAIDKHHSGKAIGHGSRTIYPNPMPTHVAKSRVAYEPVPYDLNEPQAIWRAIGCLQ